MACDPCDKMGHASCPGTSMEATQQQFTDGQETYTMVTTKIKCCHGAVINEFHSRQP